MYYDIHGPDGRIGHAYNRTEAIAKIPKDGPFCLLERRRRHSVVEGGISGSDGQLFREVMLLYPKWSKCRQYTPEEFLANSGCK